MAAKSKTSFYNLNSNRDVMTFHLPIIKRKIKESKTEIDIGAGAPIVYDYGDINLEFYRKRMYLNPSSINTAHRKSIQKQFTKGGFFVQYWGEELTTLAISGSTGSAGMSEINKLMSIYRHELIHFNNLLIQKNKEFNESLNESLGAVNSGNENRFLNTLSYLDQLLLSGQGQAVVDGFTTFTENLTNIISGKKDDPVKYKEIVQEQSLATLATSLIMEFKGIFYRGYMDGFTFTENASEPGLFNYNFNFIVLYSSGKRENFMPWHIESEVNGVSKKASVPIQGTEGDEYTYRYFDEEDQTNLFGEDNHVGPNEGNGDAEELDQDFVDHSVSAQNFRNSI